MQMKHVYRVLTSSSGVHFVYFSIQPLRVREFRGFADIPLMVIVRFNSSKNLFFKIHCRVEVYPLWDIWMTSRAASGHVITSLVSRLRCYFSKIVVLYLSFGNDYCLTKYIGLITKVCLSTLVVNLNVLSPIIWFRFR